jgi:hypothetical protein
MKWNTNDKSEALGISERHVRRLIKDGVLVQSDDPKTITLAYVRHLKESKGGKSDLIEERIRLTRAQANQKEWDLKVTQGEFIHVDTAMQLWGQVAQSMRSKLLSIPSKLAPLVIGCSGLSEIKETAEKLIHEVMEEIANPNLKKYSKVQRGDFLNMSNAKTSGKTKHLRMGRQKKSPKPRK